MWQHLNGEGQHKQHQVGTRHILLGQPLLTLQNDIGACKRVGRYMPQ
jgi:hypothetical protein